MIRPLTCQWMRFWRGMVACVLLLAAISLFACQSQQPWYSHLKQQGPIMTPKKTGVVVVLGAGGAKGLAHLGVLRALEEAHIPIDHFVGTSVGSMIAALYADYPHAAELAHYFMTLRRPDVIQYTLLNPTEGLVSNIHFQSFLTEHMHAKVFSELKIPLWVVTTDFQTGESYLIGHGPIAPAVNASSAIAGVFQPVRLYGRYLIDGGYTDPIAVDVARKLHPKVVIAVNLTAPLSKRMPHNIVSLHLRAEGIL